MSAHVIAFETQAQKEQRLYQEAMAAFDDFSAARPEASLGSINRALERLVAHQSAAGSRILRWRRPAAGAAQSRPDERG